jgi:serine/threonine protein phosphatase PrpC
METMTMETIVQREGGLEWSVLSRALPGETVSGDLHVVVPLPDGALVAVIDGLGHGDAATHAARKAIDVLSAQPGDPVVSLLRRCHEALHDTRGAAMTVMSINRWTRTGIAAGVGNVELVLIRADRRTRPGRQTIPLGSGVVGYRLPALQPNDLQFWPGDVVVLATDGLRQDFGDEIDPLEPLEKIVGRILTRKYRGTDDALVLACKLLADYES